MDDLITSSLPLPTAALVEEEKSEDQKAAEYEQVQEDYNLAALYDHPGWKKIKEMFEQDIEDFRMLKKINISALDDAHLGQSVRVERMVAEKLQEYMNRVDEAAKAVATKNGQQLTE